MRFLITTFLISIGISAACQNKEKIKLFLDCNTYCDINYLKTEITLVDFTPDNKAADVHLLITEQQNGGGSGQFQLIFYGQNMYKKQPDTIRFNTLPNSTEFENRQILSKYIQLGLSPFIAKTEAAQYATINFKQQNSAVPVPQTNTKDPWNFWVFKIGANGNFNGDKVYKGSRFGANVSATRITDEKKIIFRLNGNQNKTTYTIEDPNGVEPPFIFINKNHYYNFYHQTVKSINQHWSYGYDINMIRSTFTNYALQSVFSPAIEYNIFPYKDVNNKLLTIRYSVDIRNNQYIDTTIYRKKSETVLGQGADVSLSFTQKWGGASVGVNYHNYFLKGIKFYNLGLNGSLNVRITGGLSFNTGVFAALTRDQISLSGEGVDERDILTRRRQIASSYNYYTYFGLSYRFGSKVNNFVNPRFDSNNGGFFFSN